MNQPLRRLLCMGATSVVSNFLCHSNIRTLPNCQLSFSRLFHMPHLHFCLFHHFILSPLKGLYYSCATKYIIIRFSFQLLSTQGFNDWDPSLHSSTSSIVPHSPFRPANNEFASTWSNDAYRPPTRTIISQPPPAAAAEAEAANQLLTLHSTVWAPLWSTAAIHPWKHFRTIEESVDFLAVEAASVASAAGSLLNSVLFSVVEVTYVHSASKSSDENDKIKSPSPDFQVPNERTSCLQFTIVYTIPRDSGIRRDWVPSMNLPIHSRPAEVLEQFLPHRR